MSYSKEVLDHYENPRNVGSFNKDEELRKFIDTQLKKKRLKELVPEEGVSKTLTNEELTEIVVLLTETLRDHNDVMNELMAATAALNARMQALGTSIMQVGAQAHVALKAITTKNLATEKELDDLFNNLAEEVKAMEASAKDSSVQ